MTGGERRGDFSHKLGAISLGGSLERRRDGGESRENGLNIAALFHRDDAAMIFLVDPAQRRLRFVVEDSAILLRGEPPVSV